MNGSKLSHHFFRAYKRHVICQSNSLGKFGHQALEEQRKSYFDFMAHTESFLLLVYSPFPITIRGRSQTTLTRFWLFLTTYPPCVDIFYGINVDKKGTFLDTYSVVSIKRTGCNKRTGWSKVLF